eukprot:gene6772-7482_t
MSQQQSSSEAWDILERRLSALENSFFGDLSVEEGDGASFLDRLEQVVEKTKELDKKIPELQPCVDLLKVQYPFLMQKRSGLKQLIEKAEGLYDMKEELLDQVKALETIQSLQSFIDSPQLADMAGMMEQVNTISELYNQLQQEVSRQTREIDHLVDVYEKSMLLLNQYCLAWSWKLEKSVDSAAGVM